MASHPIPSEFPYTMRKYFPLLDQCTANSTWSLWRCEILMGGGGEGAQRPVLRVKKLKRQVRAAYGRLARPKPPCADIPINRKCSYKWSYCLRSPFETAWQVQFSVRVISSKPKCESMRVPPFSGGREYWMIHRGPGFLAVVCFFVTFWAIYCSFFGVHNSTVQ